MNCSDEKIEKNVSMMNYEWKVGHLVFILKKTTVLLESRLAASVHNLTCEIQIALQNHLVVVYYRCNSEIICGTD